MANKIARADVVKFFRVPVITIVYLCKQPAPIRGDQEIVSTTEQAIAAVLRECPCEGIVDLKVHHDTQFRVKVSQDIEI